MYKPLPRNEVISELSSDITMKAFRIAPRFPGGIKATQVVERGAIRISSYGLSAGIITGFSS
jgi:hypothetical protein